MVRLSWKKMPGFSKASFIFHLFFQKIPHINSVTNPPPILNVVFKYLKQCLGTSFGVTNLQYAATLSWGKGPDLFLQSGTFQNFHKVFKELTWSQ